MKPVEIDFEDIRNRITMLPIGLNVVSRRSVRMDTGCCSRRTWAGRRICICIRSMRIARVEEAGAAVEGEDSRTEAVDFYGGGEEPGAFFTRFKGSLFPGSGARAVDQHR